MCQFISFKCVYKGIVSGLLEAGPKGIGYDDLRKKVPNNGSTQFLKQFRYVVSENKAFQIDHKGNPTTSYHYDPSCRWIHKDYALPLVSDELSAAKEKIKELESKLALVQDTFDNLFSKVS